MSGKARNTPSQPVKTKIVRRLWWNSFWTPKYATKTLINWDTHVIPKKLNTNTNTNTVNNNNNNMVNNDGMFYDNTTNNTDE